MVLVKHTFPAETYSLVKNTKLSLDIPDHKSPNIYPPPPFFKKRAKVEGSVYPRLFFSSILMSSRLWVPIRTIYTKKSQMTI